MKHTKAIGFGVIAGILACGPNLCAEEATSSRPFALRADVNVILVPVTVLDRRGANVNGLERKSFTVLDDKVPQKIVSFSTEDAPCSVGVVLDISGSMRLKLGAAKDVLHAFLRTANSEDE